jgi:dTMP kinase
MPSFITVDGVDGVGKTTICKTIAEATGAYYFKSPSSPFNDMRATVDKIADPLTRYFFYRAATQHDSRVIRELLAQGKSVICDRYIYSTYAYHMAMDKQLANIFEMTGLLTPDFRFLLTASAEVRWQRIAERFTDQSYDKHLERDSALQQGASDVFQTLELVEINTTHMGVIEVLDVILKHIACQGGSKW